MLRVILRLSGFGRVNVCFELCFLALQARLCHMQSVDRASVRYKHCTLHGAVLDTAVHAWYRVVYLL